MELPDICFATKSYIKDIQDKDWPDLEAIAAKHLEPQGNPNHKPVYIAQNMKEGVKLSSVPMTKESDIFGIESQDLQQLVYYRCVRTPKNQKDLPYLELANYFTISSDLSIKLKISPDYSYAVNKSITSANKNTFDEIYSVVNNFDPALTTEISEAINKRIRVGKFSQISSPNNHIDDNMDNYKIRVNELEFTSEALKEMPTDKLQFKIDAIVSLNCAFHAALKFINRCKDSFKNYI